MRNDTVVLQHIKQWTVDAAPADTQSLALYTTALNVKRDL